MSILSQTSALFADCPTCFIKFLRKNAKYLFVKLKKADGTFSPESRYSYCSDKCIEIKLETLGAGLNILERVKISKKEIRMGSYHVEVEPTMLKVEID